MCYFAAKILRVKIYIVRLSDPQPYCLRLGARNLIFSIISDYFTCPQAVYRAASCLRYTHTTTGNALPLR